MINFIICTENKPLVKKILSALENTMWKDHYQVHIFSEMQDEIILLAKNKWNQNIYLFDLQCCKMNAVKLGSKIYRENQGLYFLFLTDLLEQGLPLLSCGYPFYSCLVLDENFQSNLEVRLKEIKKELGKTNALIVRDKSCNYHILFHDILYITTDTMARKTIVATTYGKVKISLPFYSLKELLGDQFVQTHRACFINISHVRKIDYQNRNIAFDNEEIIDLLSTRAVCHIKASLTSYNDKVVNF